MPAASTGANGTPRFATSCWGGRCRTEAGPTSPSTARTVPLWPASCCRCQTTICRSFSGSELSREKPSYSRNGEHGPGPFRSASAVCKACGFAVFDDERRPNTLTPPPLPPLAKGRRRNAAFAVGMWLALVTAVPSGISPLAADEGTARNVVVTDSEGKVRTGILTELGSGQLALGNIEQVRLKTRNLVSLKMKDCSSCLE